MANINQVVVTGNLTRDVDLRALPSGTSVASMRVAVNTRRKDASGEWVDQPNYFSVTVWGKQAENCAKYLGKGRGVAIAGRLQWREWEKDGVKREAVDIVAETVQFLGDGGERRPVESDLPVDVADFAAHSAPKGAVDDIPFVREPDYFEFDLWHGHANR